jgi:hypothetical protein
MRPWMSSLFVKLSYVYVDMFDYHLSEQAALRLLPDV